MEFRALFLEVPFNESSKALTSLGPISALWPSVMTLISILLILTPICDPFLDMSIPEDWKLWSIVLSVIIRSSVGGLHFSLTFWLNCFHSCHFFILIRKHICEHRNFINETRSKINQLNLNMTFIKILELQRVNFYHLVPIEDYNIKWVTSELSDGLVDSFLVLTTNQTMNNAKSSDPSTKRPTNSALWGE